MDQDIDKRRTAVTTLSHIFDKKIGELWFTNNKVSAINVYPPKINSARDFGQL